ncbi:hypothetical protein ACPA9J_11965 [Pseudomonas aeruginosa]
MPSTNFGRMPRYSATDKVGRRWGASGGEDLRRCRKASGRHRQWPRRCLAEQFDGAVARRLADAGATDADDGGLAKDGCTLWSSLLVGNEHHDIGTIPLDDARCTRVADRQALVPVDPRHHAHALVQVDQRDL